MLNEFLLDIIGALNSVMPDNYVHAIFLSVLLLGFFFYSLLVVFVLCSLCYACCKIGEIYKMKKFFDFYF